VKVKKKLTEYLLLLNQKKESPKLAKRKILERKINTRRIFQKTEKKMKMKSVTKI
jgi:hypothetical protein